MKINRVSKFCTYSYPSLSAAASVPGPCEAAGPTQRPLPSPQAGRGPRFQKATAAGSHVLC